jgi:hypothetical protein
MGHRTPSKRIGANPNRFVRKPLGAGYRFSKRMFLVCSIFGVWPRYPETVPKAVMVSRIGVICEHRSGAYLKYVSTGAQQIAPIRLIITAFNIQTVCKPGSVHTLRRWTAIPLGHALRHASTRPTRAADRKPSRAHALPHGAGRPYSVLLPVGFTLPALSPGPRCALTAPFHPCLRQTPLAVCFLWHFPWGRPRRLLAGTVFPWSPDFPPPSIIPAAAVQPSGFLIPCTC